MAVVNGYATRVQLQEHFADANSNLDVDLLDRAINAASRAIDGHCDRKFWLDAAVTTRTYRPWACHSATVDDIGSLTGLVIKTDPGLNASWSITWASDDYDLEPANANVVAAGDTVRPWAFWDIVAIGDYDFPLHSRRRTLQVTAKFGWSGVPYEVEEACLLLAAALVKRKDAPFGVAGFGDFGPMQIRNDPHVTALLHDFRKNKALVA